MTKGKTIIEKILSKASGKAVYANDRVWAEVDLAVIRDFGGPNAVLEFDTFTNKGKVKDPDKIAITFSAKIKLRCFDAVQFQISQDVTFAGCTPGLLCQVRRK